MRIKLTGKWTPETLANAIEVILGEQGFTEFFGANLYLGNGPEVITVNVSDQEAKKSIERLKGKPPQRKELKKARSTAGSLAAVSQRPLKRPVDAWHSEAKSGSATSWEPRQGAVIPKESLAPLQEDEIPW